MAVDEHGREFDEAALLKARETFNIFEHNDEIKREEIAKAAAEQRERINAEIAAAKKNNGKENNSDAG